MRERIFKLTRYIISGGTAASTAIILLFVFTHFFHIWYLLSSIIAYTIAFLVSFTLQKFWTFRSRTLEDWHVQMGIYFLIFIINLAVNTGLIYSLVEYMNVHYLLAQIISGALLACMNFFLYKYFVFTDVLHKKVPEEQVAI